MHLAICAQTKELTHIIHALPQKQYLCSVCKSLVTQVRGDIKQHHYRHQKGAPKHFSSCVETQIHKAAKEIIRRERQVTTPSGSILFFDRVELEQKVSDLRVDAVGYIGNKAYLIEICVHHAVDKRKLAKLQNINIDTLEINLQHWALNPRHLTGGKEFVIDVLIAAERTWLTRSGWPFWKLQLTQWLHRLFGHPNPEINYDPISGQSTFGF